MQTLAPPSLIWPKLSTPSCEQVTPGNITPEEEEGKLKSGEGEKPKPLQGGADAGERDRESDTGNEGTGT
jgi:hypothetical protein